MKRWLKIALAVGVLAVILNDGGRWGQAVIDLRNSTGTVLDQAALTARRMSQVQLGDELGQQATIAGIRVTQFATTPSGGVHVWTEEDVSGTWLLGPYIAMAHGVPFSKAWQTPFPVTYDAEEAMR
jgi:hypothetical protein